jgi:hypothetical protein
MTNADAAERQLRWIQAALPPVGPFPANMWSPPTTAPLCGHRVPRMDPEEEKTHRKYGEQTHGGRSPLVWRGLLGEHRE